MAKSEGDIKREIKLYIDQKGRRYPEWYVGITDDRDRRLFTEHGVDKEKGWWIARTAASFFVARRIEDYFIDLGCDGAPGGGTADSTVVYAYYKAEYTHP